MREAAERLAALSASALLPELHYEQVATHLLNQDSFDGVANDRT